MQLYQWTDALKTGNSKIDEDHKRIIEKAQTLTRALSEGQGRQKIQETIGFLKAYVKQHFAEEEALQKSSGYAAYELHKRNHTYFVEQLEILSDNILQNPDSMVHLIELNQLISGWFFNHIKKLDVDVAKHIQSVQSK